jgi:hypothetical protein
MKVSHCSRSLRLFLAAVLILTATCSIGSATDPIQLTLYSAQHEQTVDS